MFQSQFLASGPLRRLISLWAVCAAWTGVISPPAGAAEPGAVFQAGAYAMDVTPTQFPVIVNGGFFTRLAQKASDSLHARCLVLDDGTTRVGLCVLDTCVIPREFADAAKLEIQAVTGLAPERVMISATHTHSAPSLMAAHGVDVDPHYPAFLLPRLAEGFRRAVKNLAPAQVGWGVVAAPDQNHTRVWVRRPDRIGTDPFGERIVRANMHPGHQNPDVIAPSGPADTDLSFLAVRTPQGRPIAVLANYSMHYHGGVQPVSADYYGRFCDRLAEFLGANEGEPAFVAAMSQGTSGDSQWMDYSKPAKNVSVDAYAEGLARVTEEAYRQVRWLDNVSLAMQDRDLTLRTRQASPERLSWAEDLMKRIEGRPPNTLGEIYAREQLWLRDHPTRPVKLQALRVGELGIVTASAEVFGISGLKVKAQSPLKSTFFIELANGEDGYIPPPEHHPLGSYNTWACRSACLEEEAENKIVEGLLELLEEVSGKPRRPIVETHGPYAEAVLADDPLAYWRMNDFDARRTTDVTRDERRADSENGVVFYLPGPNSPAFNGSNQVNRAFHFAGGRMRAKAAGLGSSYTVEFWFWNGLDDSVRPVTGYLFSRGTDAVYGAPGDHLAIGGTRWSRGRLVFTNGGGDVSTALVGRTKIARKEWHHVGLVRDGQQVQVYLNGNPLPEISGEIESTVGVSNGTEVFFGGRSDNEANFEGRLDEIALYDRALSADDIGRHFRISGITPAPAVKEAEEMPFSAGPARVIHSLKPAAHWLVPSADEQSVVDLGGGSVVTVESGVVLPGAAQSAAAFSGGRLRATVPGLGTDYSVSFWFFNELPNTARLVTAYLFSRGQDADQAAAGDHLGIGGTAGSAGRLIVYNGNERKESVVGKTVVTPNKWHHVVWGRKGPRIQVFLDGAPAPEIDGTIEPGHDASVNEVFFGGRNDNFANLQGKLSDVAIFHRVLATEEIERIQKATALPTQERLSRAEH